ncbi:MAG: hypothetical protein HUU01_13685 [Saprospiraceae bacterium]|nr:hypothetical protein [Saprospiraceae bacterium]
MKNIVVGRKKQIAELQDALASGKPEMIAYEPGFALCSLNPTPPPKSH